MISSRNRNIVVKSQFNINGSRGKDAGKFVSDYVSRDSATEASQAYIPNPNVPPVQGDGVAFTLDQTAITRDKTLQIAQHVQDLHQTGKRAIQQMVISFDPDYLIEQKIVPDDIEIIRKGDYRESYDDVRLRHAVRSGLQSLIDNEGYRDGKAVACIQWDTRHLHVHAVVYEDATKLSRMRGSEEKGVIKESSLNRMAYDVDRHLSVTKTNTRVPNVKRLIPHLDAEEPKKEPISADVPEPVYVNQFLELIKKQEQQAELEKQQAEAENERIEAHLDDDNVSASERRKRQHRATESLQTTLNETRNLEAQKIANKLLNDEEIHENNPKL